MNMKSIPQQQLVNACLMERIAAAMREHGGDQRMAAHYASKAKRVRRMAIQTLQQQPEQQA